MRKKDQTTQRVEVVLEKRVVDRLDKLAEALGGWSRNEVAGWLLDVQTADLQYVLNKFAARLRRAVRKGG